MNPHARRLRKPKTFAYDFALSAQLQALDAEPPPKASKHARIRQEHRHLHLPADLRPTARRAGRTIGVAPIDPELQRIVSLCRRGPNKAKKLAPLPVDKQSTEWRRARDAYAAKNYDLAHRLAAKQWARNQHLEREVVPCVYCIGRKCARCRGRGEYKCQPDLERLAYTGLLEAIRRFDPAKAHCISSYAVHTMKQEMMTLLRQTPVFYPQDLLRDRRQIAALRKDTATEPTEEEAKVALFSMECTASERAKKRKLSAAEREALRGRLEAKGLGERARLALNCYYGNERKSFEEMLEERRRDDGQRRPRMADVLCVEQPRVDVDEPDNLALISALRELPATQRAEVERHLRGKGEVGAAAMASLREALL